MKSFKKEMVKDFFGLEYKINKKGVDFSTFTPNSNKRDLDGYKTYFTGLSEGLNSYRIYLVSPSFLPLKSSQNGLFEKRLLDIMKHLSSDEHVSIIWEFQKVADWCVNSFNMYESYLLGNPHPSDVNILRKLQDKYYGFANNFISSLNNKVYSEDVEEKILDHAYSFQCNLLIKSENKSSLLQLIEVILEEYTSHNSLLITEEDINSYSQVLGEKEITSLFMQEEVIEHVVMEEFDQNGDNLFSQRVNLLPRLPRENTIIDDNITTRLAESLKRVGIIKQARLQNESVSQGSRLTVINTDMPKSINFSDIEKRKKDIQVALGVQSIGVEQGDEPDSIRFSIPHDNQQSIGLEEIIKSKEFLDFSNKNNLSFIAGVDELDKPIFLSLEKLVHLGIYGTTGSGKSVFTNAFITTLILTNEPEMLSLYLIDPKQVELSQYADFPHVQEVVTDMSQSYKFLENLINIMEDRYELFKENKVKNIRGYNEKLQEKMDYIVFVIEEYADFVAVVGKEAEEMISRLGQKARAAGIHLVIITQRPSSDILSSKIKANIPNAISFNLNTSTNYRTVFGKGIPYKLLGSGDGVMRIDGWHKEFQRFQSCIISESDMEESNLYEELCKTYDVRDKKKKMYVSKTDPLKNLKTIIANTRETRLAVLREMMNIKMETLIDMMSNLVTEEWLIKHKSKSKGYELIATEEMIKEYKDDNG